MCGISGYFSLDNTFSREDLFKMNKVLSHRGPDAEGFFNDNIVGFAHKRLSILDLSDRANQPMYSKDNRYVIIYNGEIYNFQEIGAKLKSFQTKLNFTTSCDTEVILEAFIYYGINFINELNGMFSIAIYDTVLNELYLIRDRIGIKPLYYYWDGKNLVFASEIKTFLQLNQIKKAINKSAIKDFLNLGYIPAPKSIYQNIFKLEPGNFIHINKEGVLQKQKYWDIKQKFYTNVIKDREQTLVKLSDLLVSSVQYQLKSDVPFGVFLSGGIDSSLITAQAVELSSIKVNTFSIGFEENSHNESQYAKAIAKYLRTDHHEFMVSYRDALGLIDKIFDVFDEPFADSSSIPTLLISKLAKPHVTVTLSGEGGDELFLGYGFYIWANRLNNSLFKNLRHPLNFILSKQSSRYKRISELLNYNKTTDLKRHIFSQEQYCFSEKEVNELFNPTFIDDNTNFSSNIEDLILTSFNGYDVQRQLEVKERKLNALESQALFDILYYLPDDLLTKVDRSSMNYSLETRVPYLDHRVVEFALNISPELKYKNGEAKYILKEILYQYIPKKFFKRPKQGFSIPLILWMKKELKYLIEDNLSEEIIERWGIIKYDTVKSLIHRFNNNEDYLYQRLWLLIVLHKWLEKNKPLITI